MRRCIFLLILCVSLGACGRSSDLPPQEVLKRSARSSQELKSARFFLVAKPRWEYQSGGGDLTLNLDGRLQDGGDQVQFLTSVQGDIRGIEGAGTSLTSAFEVVVSAPEEIYLNIHTVESQPPYPSLQSPALTAVIGKWLQLSAPVSPSPPSSVAPDPHLLKMQSEVVDVLKDRGVENVSGRLMYHYDVRLNTEKLVAFLQEVARNREEPVDTKTVETLLAFVRADGELFIDAETFFIHRLVWRINTEKLPFGTFSLDLTLDLKDHGKAPPIIPPPDAILFSSVPSLPMSMDTFSSDTLFQKVTPSLEEELMDSVIDDGP